MTFTTVDVTAKRLGQLHEVVPAAELIGLLVDPNTPESDLEVRAVREALNQFGGRERSPFYLTVEDEPLIFGRVAQVAGSHCATRVSLPQIARDDAIRSFLDGIITGAMMMLALLSHGFCASLDEAKAKFAETWRAWLTQMTGKKGPF